MPWVPGPHQGLGRAPTVRTPGTQARSPRGVAGTRFAEETQPSSPVRVGPPSDSFESRAAGRSDPRQAPRRRSRGSHSCGQVLPPPVRRGRRQRCPQRWHGAGLAGSHTPPPSSRAHGRPGCAGDRCAAACQEAPRRRSRVREPAQLGGGANLPDGLAPPQPRACPTKPGPELSDGCPNAPPQSGSRGTAG